MKMNWYIITFEGTALYPYEFYTKASAEQIAKALNRAGNYKLYKAVKFSTYTERRWR